VGVFEFSGIADGKYSVQVLKPGFRAFEIPDVTISRGGQLDVMLEVGRISEQVTVVGQGQRRQPPATTSSTPRRIRVGGNMQPAKLLSRVQPQYPPHLAAQGIEGTVLLQAVIGTKGQVLGAEARNWKVDPDFIKAAVEAVKQWQYEPTLLNGVPVEVVATITVDFRLNP
jgi:TonB family protein